ncbi:MAG: universal stress protein [Acidimicrobiia bacterium]|nr:universal stress protein [Acidimicrobiia bacterium]
MGASRPPDGRVERIGGAVARIVVGVDESEPARAALEWACGEARYWEGPELVVVHAWEYPYRNERSGRADLRAEMAEDAAAALDDLAAAARAAGGDALRITPQLVEGSPRDALVAAGQGADLLVVGNRGRGGFATMLLGSVSHQVAQHAPCAVVIVRPEAV